MANPPVLIHHPNEEFRVWHMDDIYFPPKDKGHVPNLNDLVFDYTSGFYRVVDVDITTGISQLQPWTLPMANWGSQEEDILLGRGPGTITEHYRAYINTSVTPHTLALDGCLHMYTSTASFMKVFKGIDVSAQGQVISAFYDNTGMFIGENIPLMPVAMMDASNIAVKAPAVGATNMTLPDGELVTAVFYDDLGEPISKQTLIVKNTAFIRTTDASLKYITEISLETPFISASDPTVIEYPINMPVNGLNLVGVVHYSDGSEIRLPVDGTKFSIHGLHGFVSTVQGQQLDVVLLYKLGPTEYNYIQTPNPEKTIGRLYTASVKEHDGAYSVKLFGYPVWQDPLTGYRMEYWLYTLDRGDFYNVTHLTQLTSTSMPFNPTLYATKQTISVAIDLNQADALFKAWHHVQTFEVSLLRRGDEFTGDNWTIGFTPGQNPPYGVGVRANAHMVNQNLWELNITCGLTNKQDWLDKVYYAIQPLFDSQTEIKAPEPNYMKLHVGSESIETLVSTWNQLMTFQQMPPEGGLVWIEWIKRDGQNDLQLGKSAMIVKHN